MNDSNPMLTSTDKVLMYGDRVRFYHVDNRTGWKDYLEAIYAGPDIDQPSWALVTVVTQCQYCGDVMSVPMAILKKAEDTVGKDTEPKRQFNRSILVRMRDEIISNFNFDRVADTMKLLCWTWWGKGVPDKETIIQEASRLLDEIIVNVLDKNENSYTIATGGFEAHLEVCDDGIPDMSLKFVVEDWSEGYDDWDFYRED